MSVQLSRNDLIKVYFADEIESVFFSHCYVDGQKVYVYKTWLDPIRRLPVEILLWVVAHEEDMVMICALLDADICYVVKNEF